MTYADFYLTCFIVGLALSCLSFLLGSFHWHLPHLTDASGIGHAGGDFHVHFGGEAAGGADAAGGGHIGDAGHAAAGHAGDAAFHGAPHVSPVNFMTLTAFMAWFGGTGYLLARFSNLWMLAGLLNLWALWRGVPWMRTLIAASAFLYTCWYWGDRLLFQPGRPDWLFSAVVNLLLLLHVLYALNSDYFRREAYERQP